MNSPLRVEEVSGGFVVKDAAGKAMSSVLSLAEASKLSNSANCFPEFVRILFMAASGDAGVKEAAKGFLGYLGNYVEA